MSEPPPKTRRLAKTKKSPAAHTGGLVGDVPPKLPPGISFLSLQRLTAAMFMYNKMLYRASQLPPQADKTADWQMRRGAEVLATAKFLSDVGMRGVPIDGLIDLGCALIDLAEGLGGTKRFRPNERRAGSPGDGTAEWCMRAMAVIAFEFFLLGGEKEQSARDRVQRICRGSYDVKSVMDWRDDLKKWSRRDFKRAHRFALQIYQEAVKFIKRTKGNSPLTSGVRKPRLKPRCYTHSANLSADASAPIAG
jgi:hypothetical protein